MESQELKEYLIKFAESKLNGCEVFTKIFGKKIVRNRLEKNLDKVYTQIVSRTRSGGYDINTSCINLYSLDSDKPVTVQGIKDNKELQQTVLHEVIHAIFKRTKEECITYGIKSGTGISENYTNGHDLGRGLNEGLTEWIVEKAGYEQRVYDSEYNIVKMLELALGEQRVMQLANGNIRENAPKVLGMSQQECLQLLAEADVIYKQEGKIYSLIRIKRELASFESKMLTKQDEQMLEEKMGEDYNKYVELMKSMKETIGEDKEPNNLDHQIKYLNLKLKDETRILDQDIAYTEQIIFNKYFKKEIEDAINAEDISEQTMDRLDKLYELVRGGTTLENTSGDSLPIKFRAEIHGQLFEKYLNTIRKQQMAEEVKGRKQKNNVRLLGKIKRVFHKAFNRQQKQQSLPEGSTSSTLQSKKAKDEFSQNLSNMIESETSSWDKKDEKALTIEIDKKDTIDIN